MRHARSLVLAVTLTCFATPALASPQDLFGFGPRSSAMGALGATFADDYSAVHANPAGLSRARLGTFSFGYVTGTYAIGYNVQTPQGSIAQPVYTDPIRATVIGLTLPLPFGGALRDRIAIGLGFYTPTDVVVRGRILRPDQPQFLVIADRAQSVALQLGIGFDLGYGLRVGAGFAALAAITGTVAINTDATGRASSRVDDQLVASYATVLGASWERGPFRIGAVFRDKVIARFGVTITAMNIGIPLPVFNIAGIAQYDPWQIAGEAAYAHDGWVLAAGVTFKRWSEYPGPLERTTMTSLDPPAPSFHDTWVARIGGERAWRFRQSRVAARAGYFFEPSPAPQVTTLAAPSAYFDNDRHVITGGLLIGGRLAGTEVTGEFFAQAHLLVDQSAAQNGSSLRYGGALYVAGIAGTVSF